METEVGGYERGREISSKKCTIYEYIYIYIYI